MVKGIVGGLFGLLLFRLCFVWEIGEWDFVVGFDDEVVDSDEEGEDLLEIKEDLDDVVLVVNIRG